MTLRKPVKLLVIDDEESYCSLIREGIEMCSYQYDFSVQYTHSGVRALELLKTWDPSVVLLDMHLVSSDPLEILKVFKDGVAPVIVTSYTRSQEIEASARLRGASGYLQKSDNPDDIECLIHELASVSSGLNCRH